MEKLLDRVKNILLTSGLYFLYLLAASILSMLVEALLVFLINKVIVIDYHALTIIRISIYSVFVPSILGVLTYAEGYKEASFSAWELVLSFLPAAILHLLFSMLFKFQGFISGSVRFTAGLIANGTSITYDSLINVTPYETFLWVFGAYSVLYCLVMALSKYYGAQNRIISRGELRKHERDQSQT